MSSLIQCFAAIAGIIFREKTKNGYYKPPPPNGYLSEIRCELRTCPNYWWIKVLPAYCHFKEVVKNA